MSFDLVTCRLAAHHFASPRAFVAEAYRVLMPGGVLALVDNISPDADILPALEAAQVSDLASAYNQFEKLRDPSHGRCLGLAEWTALLVNAGFAVVHKRAHGSGHRVRPLDAAHALRRAHGGAAEGAA